MVVYYVTQPRLSLMFFSANQNRVHSWATYLCRCNYAALDFVEFIVNISEQTNNFFSMTRVLLGLLIFFREIMLESWGCGLYTSLYGTFNCDKHIYANYFYIFNLHLKMTSRRSKRHGFLSLVFIIKSRTILQAKFRHFMVCFVISLKTWYRATLSNNVGERVL